ncbi:hypothetical protein P7D22_08680 [Lichenihabitans sp. Uapishka_5]|uniref:hypothetical protein n=1 Tax=Lichenihabitans sp. Uapishka_5 TaxID=3037302 RepID=UPI0029E823EF|nr:hypothetical protein [Lichenihabitans sp. Uapishka_5]MDX7951251.1 hypothetical protein [Lichenihabitans sp. Uapishka_5]
MQQIYLRPYAKFVELAEIYDRLGELLHADHQADIGLMGDLDRFPDEEPIDQFIDSAIRELGIFHRIFTDCAQIEADEAMVHRFFAYCRDHGMPTTLVCAWLLAFRNPAATQEDIAAAERDLVELQAERWIRRLPRPYTPSELQVIPHYRPILAREQIPDLTVHVEVGSFPRLAVHAVFEYLHYQHAPSIDPQLLRTRVFAERNLERLVANEIRIFVELVGEASLAHILDGVDERPWGLDHIIGHFESTLPAEQKAEYDALGPEIVEFFRESVNIRRSNVIRMFYAKVFS